MKATRVVPLLLTFISIAVATGYGHCNDACKDIGGECIANRDGECNGAVVPRLCSRGRKCCVDRLNDDDDYSGEIPEPLEPGGGGGYDHGYEPGGGRPGECVPDVSYWTCYDFSGAFPDMQNVITGIEQGLVEPALNNSAEAGVPVLDTSSATPGITNAQTFAKWFRHNHDNAGPFNISLPIDSAGRYRDRSFFPLDDMGFGNEGRPHNYHFTCRTSFILTDVAGPSIGNDRCIWLGSDDDSWAFLDNQLIIDIGGVHPFRRDSYCANLDFTMNQTYRLDVFFAERHIISSGLELKNPFCGFQPPLDDKDNQESPSPADEPSPSPPPITIPTPSPVSVPSPTPSPVSTPPPTPSPVSTPSPTPSPVSVPSPTLSPVSTPSPTPSPVSVPSSTPSPVSVPSPTPSPVSVPSPTPSPVSTPSPTPSPVSTPSPTPSPVSTPSPTPSPVSVPFPTPSPVSTPSPTPSPVSVPSPTPSPVSVPSPTPSPVSVPSSTPSPVSAPSPTPSPVGVPSPTPSPVSTPSSTPSPVSTPSPTPSPVSTPSPMPGPVSVPFPTPSPVNPPPPSPSQTPEAVL